MLGTPRSECWDPRLTGLQAPRLAGDEFPIPGHIWSNKVMDQRAKVSELKAKLSQYLAQVRDGGTVMVMNRKIPVARLVPVDDRSGGIEVVEAADAEGLPNGPRIRLKKRRDVVALLRSERADR